MTRGAVTVLATLMLLMVGCDRPEPEGRLRDRLRGATTPEVLDFVFEAGGTTVTRCFQPNRTFTGTIDFARKTVVLGSADGSPLAVVTPEATLVRSALFADPPPATWTRIPKDLTGAELDAVKAAVGVEFMSYLVGESPPSTPAQVVAAALDVASEVTESRAGARSTYSVIVDDRELDEVASREGVTTTMAGEPVAITVVASFTDDSIVSVTVDPGGSTDRPRFEDQDAPIGWTTTYRPRVEPNPLPQIGDIAEPGPEALQTLRAAPIATCQVRP